MTRQRTIALCHESAVADLIQSAFGGEPIAPEDAYTRVTVSPETKWKAARQWADIPDDPAAIAAWMRGEPL
ncbi:hypothetical protein [Synechococcus phage Yong-M3-232]|nr:hypothetical protein [Synechococcus phage Yong-M3-232]